MDVYACLKCVLIKCHLLGQEGFIAGLLTLYHFHVILTVCKIIYEIYIQTIKIKHLWQIRDSHLLSLKILHMWEKSARQDRTTKKKIYRFLFEVYMHQYVFIYFWYSIIHTASKLYLQTQIHTYTQIFSQVVLRIL